MDEANTPVVHEEPASANHGVPSAPVETKPPARGSLSALVIGMILLAGLSTGAFIWGNGFKERFERAESNRKTVMGLALHAVSGEFRVAHYALMSFLESGEPALLAEAKAALGPAVRVASRVLENVDKESTASKEKSYIEAVGSATGRLGECVDLIGERTKYYGKVQDLDRKVIQRLLPRMLTLADATAFQSASPAIASRTQFTEHDRQVVLTSSTAIREIADDYLTLGIMPEEKPAMKVTQTAAADAARKALKLGSDYVYKTATERFSKWQGTHYWEVVFAQGNRTLEAYVSADTARVAGYKRSDHTVLSKGEMPAMTRGEALAKARAFLPQIPQVPQDLLVGPVEFNGTWQVTYWPRVGGVVYYSHPIIVWVDGKSNEPYGYHFPRIVVRPPMVVSTDPGYATSLAKKMTEKGWMKEAFKTYRGSTYLAVVRSDITGEDTGVWAVEFVISSRFHENTGYDMVIMLMNTRDARYEGYKGLGDGPWRVDRWQTK